MTHLEIQSVAAPLAAVKPPSRMLGLDVTKGALVLLMVVYHWTNYFVEVNDFTFRYVRFLTPSFIFITGFLIGQVYLPRTGVQASQVPARLALRGCKLLTIVLTLNLALRPASLADFGVAFFTGAGPVAFSILVPISYLLLGSAALFLLRRVCSPGFHLASASLTLAALACEQQHVASGHLEALSIGMLGVSVGHISMASIQQLLGSPLALAAAYAAYAAAIARWNAVYLLQIAGVCLNLAVLYVVGESSRSTSGARLLSRLGGYSLFAYIAQIAILQVLRAGLRPLGSVHVVAGLALFLGILLTVLSVEILDRARRRMVPVDRVYRVVFA